MPTISCVLCGSPVDRKSARLTEKRDGFRCGDIEACEMRQAEKNLPSKPAEVEEENNAQVG